MKTISSVFRFRFWGGAALLWVGFAGFGCSSSMTSSPPAIQGSVYYGVGWGDPYFYGSPWYGGGHVVMPPPHRPPIRPKPMPTVPPRPMPR